MPKVLIREYDNSTTGFPASDNFAVVVPGFFGEHSGDEKEILIDYDVYEVKSQKDFDTYIGKHPGSAMEAVAPVLEEKNVVTDTNEYDEYSRYLKKISYSDFDTYISESERAYIYQVTEITDTNDKKYGKNGYLYKTIKYYKKTNVDPETGEETSSYIREETPREVTISLTKINSINEIDWTFDPEKEKYFSSTNMYCIIEKGNEGSDEIQEPHIGNQIAYELLGLGYTVLFKKLTNTNDLNESAFWEPLKDKSIFNFRYVMTGGYYNAAAMNQICQLAKFNKNISLETAETVDSTNGRGDCIALCDIDETKIKINGTINEIITGLGTAVKQITNANEYSAIFGPRVIYSMSFPEDSIYQNKTFPASFHYLACAARTFDRYNEWYAVAGYSRGISNYSIAGTSIKLGEIAINTLAPRVINNYTNKSVNLILHERGNYYLWGNRTAYTLDNKGLVFNHFLNIRQLCTTIKKQLYTACRQFTFDPNSDLLWINFCNAIKPTLDSMVADQGIKGYTITKTANDKKALLTARIRIVPIEAVEDFDISIYLEDSLTGIIVSTTENQA